MEISARASRRQWSRLSGRPGEARRTADARARSRCPRSLGPAYAALGSVCSADPALQVRCCFAQLDARRLTYKRAEILSELRLFQIL